MNYEHEIHNVACQLATENKTPSVALIKARLTTSIPLAVIIRALKNWQQNPEPIQHLVDPVTEPNPKSLDEELVLKINETVRSAVAPLEQEIERLKKLIEQLK